MTRRLLAVLLLTMSAGAGADPTYHFVMAERAEYRASAKEALWDAQGWHGGDYNKFWWKTEGDFGENDVEEAELQLLYSRAWTAWFDWQAGVRFQEIADTRLETAVLGIQGLAPYRFETDVAMFVSADGDVFARLEFEREILFSQKLILQPRAEINLSLDDVPELGLGSGINELALEARLRYEFTRKFAPYVGVSWTASFGRTADFMTAAGEDDRDTTIVAGLRVWF